MDWLLDPLEQARSGIEELRCHDGVRLAVVCDWWSAHGHGGPALWPAQMERLAELELELSFDIVFCGTEKATLILGDEDAVDEAVSARRYQPMPFVEVAGRRQQRGCAVESAEGHGNVHHVVPYLDENADCERAAARILIYPGAHTPDWVTETLQVEPTQTVRGGVPQLNPRSGIMHTPPLNLWEVDSEEAVDSRELRRHLDWVLDRIEPASQALRQLQADPEVEMRMGSSWWSASGKGGPTLWPTQMRRMARLGLSWSVDAMFFGDEES